MPLDATGTRAKLIAAGERHFATNGIQGAQMRHIVRDAGQANDSAVHYHFGSRAGLLTAICQHHIDEMRPDRERRLAMQPDSPELQTVITDLVRPTAERLHTRSGRYFLRITAQLAGHAGVRDGMAPPRMIGPALRSQLEQVQQVCMRSMPAALAGERIAFMVGALTTALADRAVATDQAVEFAIAEDAFVANLEAMLVAALLAPVPAETAAN